MKLRTILLVLVLAHLLAASAHGAAPQLRVVTTLPDYAVLAQAIGGDRVSVESIVRGEQDAHFIRPKPSFVNLVRNADVLVDTGLDLEIWVQTVIDRSGNTRVRSGQPGYVAAAQGMRLLGRPTVLSRIEGGLHIYGNPHVTCSPINMKVAAANIAEGLISNDPAGRTVYERNLRSLQEEIDRRLFGDRLVQLLGGETLCDLAQNGRLISFLESHNYQGRPLLDELGGWLGEMMPLRDVPIATYHANWLYFVNLFGLQQVGTIEPKPGIPPSARHVSDLVQLMRQQNVRIVLAANYFDAERVRSVAARVDGVAVIVPLYVGGEPGVDDYFQLCDLWITRLQEAARQTEAVHP